MKQIFSVCVLLLCGVTIGLSAQDFGFGFDDAGEEGPGSAAGGSLAISIGGEVGMALLSYTDDLFKGFGQVWRPGRIDSRLNFSAGGPFGEAVVNLKVNPAGFIAQEQGESDTAYHGFSNILTIDETYLRTWFGDFELEAGMRKLVWGKADSLGPLDVINPLDYSELTDLNDAMNLKIANALIHGSYRFGQFSKVEAVFVPVFEPWHFAAKGRWAPAQMSSMMDGFKPVLSQLAMTTGTYAALDADKKAELQAYTGGQLAAQMSGMAAQITSAYPDTTTMNYAQTGLRFTTTIGSADIGVQYYYGWLPQPAIDMSAFAASMQTAGMALAMAANETAVDAALAGLALPKIVYNPYHQVGIDWAQVLLGFNVRAELAANITGDLAGDDGAVYNPQLAWSFGFDRDLVWGINLNLQANETVRLFHDKIDSGAASIDTEAGTDVTSTRLTGVLSKKFLRDELELRAAALWGIEDKDFLVMPALIWTRDAVSIEFSGGIFGGDKDGQLGQYRDNDFVKVGITYTF